MASTDDALAWLTVLRREKIDTMRPSDGTSLFVLVWVIKQLTDTQSLLNSRNRYKRLYLEALETIDRLENRGVPTIDTTTVRLYRKGRWDDAFTTHLKKEGDRLRITAKAIGRSTVPGFHMVAKRFGMVIRTTKLANGDIMIRRYS